MAASVSPPPDRQAGAKLIRFEQVSKVYPIPGGADPITALTGVDLTVQAGTIHGIIGRSGAGKSTLIRLINGLERPSSGRVFIGDVEVSRLTEREMRAVRSRVGMIFSISTCSRRAAPPTTSPCPWNSRVGNAARSASGSRSFSRWWASTRRRPLSDRAVGRAEAAGRDRAGARDRAEVLLSDEATSALDPETTRSILTLLKRINVTLGLTIVLITHEMSVIRAVADEVAVIEGGAIVEAGSAFEVFTRPRSDITRRLLATETGLAVPPRLAARIGAAPRPGAAPVLRLHFQGPGGDAGLVCATGP